MHRFNVIFVAALAAAGQAALWSQTQSHSEATKISANLVSFYEVPLACPAARGLGLWVGSETSALGTGEEEQYPGSLARPSGNHTRNRMEEG